MDERGKVTVIPSQQRGRPLQVTRLSKLPGVIGEPGNSALVRIEEALDTLLRAAIEDDLRFMRTSIPGGPRKIAFRLDDPMPTSAEREAAALIDQPVGTACRHAVRRLGEHLFGLVGTVDAMRQVLERAAGRDPGRYGRRLAIADAAWNGIGAGADVWAS